MRETWVWSLGWEDPLEKGTATHSSVLAWRSLVGYSPRGAIESDTTERLRFPSFFLSLPLEWSRSTTMLFFLAFVSTINLGKLQFHKQEFCSRVSLPAMSSFLVRCQKWFVLDGQKLFLWTICQLTASVHTLLILQITKHWTASDLKRIREGPLWCTSGPSERRVHCPIHWGKPLPAGPTPEAAFQETSCWEASPSHFLRFRGKQESLSRASCLNLHFRGPL